MRIEDSEVFELYKRLADEYWLIFATIEIDGENGMYHTVHVSESCYHIAAGTQANDEIICETIDGMDHKVSKPGLYGVELLLKPVSDEHTWAEVVHVEYEYDMSLDELRKREQDAADAGPFPF